MLAVVVHYRGAGATVRCMRAVQGQGWEGSLRGVVVNNAYPNGEGSWEVVRAEAEALGWEMIDAGNNTGFAGGSNLGISRAIERGDEYVWLINPDALAEPGALGALAARMERDPRLGAVGSDLGGGPPGGRVSLWRGKAAEIGDGGDGKFEFVSGASVLLRLGAVSEVGMFDEALFLYWEDVELCMRLRAAGWALAVERTSRVRHEGGGAVGRASPTQDYYATRNPLLVVQKHMSWALPLAAVAVLGRVTILKTVRGEWSRLGASLRGWWDGVRGRGGRRD